MEVGRSAFEAHFEDKPDKKARGESHAASIGALVKKYPEELRLELVLPE